MARFLSATGIEGSYPVVADGAGRVMLDLERRDRPECLAFHNLDRDYGHVETWESAPSSLASLDDLATP